MTNTFTQKDKAWQEDPTPKSAPAVEKLKKKAKEVGRMDSWNERLK